MATRVYMTSRACGTNLVGPLLGEWSAGDSTRAKRGDTHWTLLADASKANGGVIVSMASGASETASANQPLPLCEEVGSARWASRPLAADVAISGTITLCHKTTNPSEAALAAASGRLYAYVSVGDSLTERAPLIVNQNNATAWTATATYREMSYSITGSVNALAGDRLILEAGARVSPPTAPAGDASFLVKYGTTNISNVAQADAVNGDTADRAAWIEFSTDVTFAAAPSPPVNDACADAIVVSSVPYVSSAIDTTESTDTSRRVWWTFTPTVSGRYFVTTLGGNYQTTIRVHTGTCAGLVAVTTEGSISWIGRSESIATWEATAGTPYLIWVQNGFATSGAQAGVTAIDSGGSLIVSIRAYDAPQDGDLFVSCQHLVCYRNGTLINANTATYGDTPTNSVIDYSLQTMDDNNGGTNSARRLYVAMFGTDPLVNIFDLETLNVDEGEIDFIFDPLNYVGHSENMSSIVMDAYAPGTSPNIIMGYFGDHYSVSGGLSTPDQCRVNRMPAIDADNQSGAPFAAAEAFTVAQENEGSDYVDLAVDKTTLFYTSAGVLVKRFDLDANQQLADFATLPTQDPATTPRPGARGVRLLPPYDGTGGCLVAYGTSVVKLDGSGTVVGEFTPTESAYAQDLDKVELTPDALSAWVSDQYSTWLFRFSLATMTQETAFPTHLPPGQLCGFTVLGYRGAGAPEGFADVTEMPIRRLRRSPHTTLEQLRIAIHRVQVDLQPGIGAVSGQGIDPAVMFRFSYDGGYTWSNERSLSAGRQGHYLARAQTYRLGQARDWVFEVVVSDPVVPWVLLQLIYDPDPGTS